MSKLEELYREAADKSTVEQQYDPPYLSEDLFIDEAKEIIKNAKPEDYNEEQIKWVGAFFEAHPWIEKMMIVFDD